MIETVVQKLTELSQAIKNKNPNLSGKLSIQGLIDGVNHIPLGGIGSGTFYRCASSDNLTWTGYECTQDANGGWTVSGTLTQGLRVSGYTPQVGEIQSSDTTIWVKEAWVPTPGKMVCLLHFENTGDMYVDSTQTCIVRFVNQISSHTVDKQKFGDASCWYNYYDITGGGGGCINLIELPELDAFTIEFWHYHTYYNSMPFTAPVIYMPATDMQPEASVPGYAFDHNAALNRWVHRAFVRGAGSNTVTEYWDGQQVATHTLSALLGGDRLVRIGGGSQIQSDAKDYLDELAIFNYAKYLGNSYEVPTRPYSDIISGIRQPSGIVREVRVSGLETIPFANDTSYALVDPTKTGTRRVWKTVDNKWYIYYDYEYEHTWVIANGTSAYADDWICVAKLNAQDEPDSEEPIGNSYWVDIKTNMSIFVGSN